MKERIANPAMNGYQLSTKKKCYYINPNHPGPCVCKYDTNIGAYL